MACLGGRRAASVGSQDCAPDLVLVRLGSDGNAEGVPGCTGCGLRYAQAGVIPARATGRVRSLWLLLHGWRTFLIYKDNSALREKFIERLMRELRGGREAKAVPEMIEQLAARQLIVTDG